MWFILGMIVLIIIVATIEVVALIKIEDRKNLWLVGYITGTIVAIIIGARFIIPGVESLQTKVNEITTELYESYSLIDSLKQQEVYKQ